LKGNGEKKGMYVAKYAVLQNGKYNLSVMKGIESFTVNIVWKNTRQNYDRNRIMDAEFICE
jgi:hypothetical protein